jgi:hypothetical protein
LGTFPALADADCDGVLSAGQINVLKTACPTALEPILADQQHDIVTILDPLRSSTATPPPSRGANAPTR